MPKKQPYKILSVGGSIIIPKTGFDIDFLKKFRALILERVKNGDRFIMVVGGGTTARQYQDATRSLVPTVSRTDLDWVGIQATIINAHFVQKVFGAMAHRDVVINPTEKIKTSKSIIIAAGWKPGCSTDKDAVLLAKTYGAKEVINLSNIDQVYTKDPRTNPDAKAIDSMDWATFRKEIVGNTWEPGKNVPFDPIASKLAQKMKLKVSMIKGTDLAQVENALIGRQFFGTTIHP